jgi:DUF1365 family protein
MSASAIYTGHVAHTRPGAHRLRYRIFMLAVDIDELPALNARLKFFSHNRVNLAALFDSDHGDKRDEPLRSAIGPKLRQAGLEWDDGRILLLTMPRLFNYVFNPLSVYFCYRQNGELAGLVYEVSNTFGERHFYVSPSSAISNGQIAHECVKRFFVSPFLEMDLSYDFAVTAPNETCAISIIVKRGPETALSAGFVGARSLLTDANLLRVWLAHPLMTLKVIVAIYWEALKMWSKGIRYLGRGPVKT